MRKIVYGGAIAAVTLLAGGVVVQSQHMQVANATPAVQTRGMVDIRALEASIDVAALPTHDMLSEADE
jgi:hypothetical protein